jgi:phage-related protein
VNIVPGTVAVENYLKTQLGGQVASAGDAAGDGLARSVSGGFGSKIKGYLAPVIGTMVASFGALQVVNFFGNAVKESSDLNESLNAVNVTFGKNSQGILDLGKKAAQSVGLSKNEFNGLAVQFSAFAQTVAGKGGDVVGTMKDLTQRGADFASVMNLNVNDAMALFQSGLAGESEPLRRYGLDLSAAAVESQALSMHLGTVTKHGVKLSEAEKVQARYALLMKSTAKNAGDFANTSDQLANKQRITNARFKDAQAALGDNLRPVMLELTNFANDVLVPAVNGMAGAFKWAADNANIVVPILAGLGTAIVVGLAPSIWAAVTATWAWTAAMLANPITWIVLGIAALVAAIVALAMNWDAVTKWVSDVWNGFVKWLTDGLNGIATWWNGVWSGITKFFQDTWNNIAKFFSDTWNNIAKFFSDAWTNFYNGIKTAWNGVTKFFTDFWNGLTKFFSDAWNNISTGVQNGITNVVNFFSGLGDKVIGVLSGAGKWLFDTGKNLIQGLIDGAGSLLRNLGNFFLNMVPSWIRDPFKQALGIHSPSRVFHEFGVNIGEGLVNGLNEMQKPLKDAVTDLGIAAQDTFDVAMGKVNNLVADRNAGLKKLMADGMSAGNARSVVDKAFGGPLQNVIDSALGQATFTDKLGNSVTFGSLANMTRQFFDSQIVPLLSNGYTQTGGPKVVAPAMPSTGGAQVVNYYAAPNESLDSEQALFQAMKRAKAVGAW